VATDGLKPRVKYAVHIAARYSCDAVAEEAIAETRRRVVKPDACDELTLAAQRWATRARRRRRHPSRPSSRRSCPQHCVCVDRCVEAMDGSACLPPSLPHPRTVTEQGLHWGNAGGQAGTRERERARARGSYDATIGSQCSSTCEHWYACPAPVAGCKFGISAPTAFLDRRERQRAHPPGGTATPLRSRGNALEMGSM
jgi:hypothetical protein